MKEQVKTAARLARFAVLGLSMGMPIRTACTHAMEAENLKNYAAALGYSPGDVAAFLEQGLSIEQAKYRMTLGERPRESGS